MEFYKTLSNCIEELKSDHFGIEITPRMAFHNNSNALKSDHFGIEIQHHPKSGCGGF